MILGITMDAGTVKVGHQSVDLDLAYIHTWALGPWDTSLVQGNDQVHLGV